MWPFGIPGGYVPLDIDRGYVAVWHPWWLCAS
jgi:hypothetical protein